MIYKTRMRVDRGIGKGTASILHVEAGRCGSRRGSLSHCSLIVVAVMRRCRAFEEVGILLGLSLIQISFEPRMWNII